MRPIFSPTSWSRRPDLPEVIGHALLSVGQRALDALHALPRPSGACSSNRRSTASAACRAAAVSASRRSELRRRPARARQAHGDREDADDGERGSGQRPPEPDTPVPMSARCDHRAPGTGQMMSDDPRPPAPCENDGMEPSRPKKPTPAEDREIDYLICQTCTTPATSSRWRAADHRSAVPGLRQRRARAVPPRRRRRQ